MTWCVSPVALPPSSFAQLTQSRLGLLQNRRHRPRGLPSHGSHQRLHRPGRPPPAEQDVWRSVFFVSIVLLCHSLGGEAEQNHRGDYRGDLQRWCGGHSLRAARATPKRVLEGSAPSLPFSPSLSPASIECALIERRCGGGCGWSLAVMQAQGTRIVFVRIVNSARMF